MTPDPWCTGSRHGDRNAYCNSGCRCTSGVEAARAYRREHPEPRRIPYADPAERFPIAPFLALVAAAGIVQEHTNVWKLYQRAKNRGYCSAVTADALAVQLLGMHPAEVWGDAWWTEFEEEDAA